MVVALRAIAQRAGAARNQVVIPAYTCYSVPAAVERAGLTPVLCDVIPSSLSLDLVQLERIANGPVAAIVTANLFGIPNELAEIERIARRHGVALLDDAAQALGARLAGRPVGGFGDAGLFSFDKGKNISTMQGGALVARDGPIAAAIEEQFRCVGPPRTADTALSVAKLLAYSLFLGPRPYAWVRRLPLLRLGETRYDLEYPLTRFSPILAGVAHGQLQRLDRLQAGRTARAAEFREALAALPGLGFIDPPDSAEPAYPRFPVRAGSRQGRERIVQALVRAGIGASAFYPAALPDVPEVARRMAATGFPHAGAREIASTIFTLPTHSLCPPRLAVKVRDTILSAAPG
jgi:dTDP-4-amino-4,6-dideoxygalactose transaminase